MAEERPHDRHAHDQPLHRQLHRPVDDRPGADRELPARQLERAEARRRDGTVALVVLLLVVIVASVVVDQWTTTPVDRLTQRLADGPVGSPDIDHERLSRLWTAAGDGDTGAGEQLARLLSHGPQRPSIYGPDDGSFVAYYDSGDSQCVVFRWFDDGSSSLAPVDRRCDQLDPGVGPPS